MSLPPRPQPSSPIRPQYNQHSPSTRRPRPQDLEASAYTDPATGTRHTPTRKASSGVGYGAKMETPRSPGTPVNDREPLTAGGGPGGVELGRKKSLIRPERGRITREHPNYHYRQHAQAQGMNVIPSSTGNDPVAEDGIDVDTTSSDSTTLKSLTRREPGDSDNSPPRRVTRRPRGAATTNAMNVANKPRIQRKLTRKDSKRFAAEEKRRDEDLRPPSLWDVYCLVITFWCPGAILKCFGKPSKAQQRAWREKMGLLSIILLIGAFVGFLTFGFTAAVCGTPGLRLKVNRVDTGYMIFHGSAYQLSESTHPAALGIPGGSNVLYDLPEKFGGKDGSFLFQNVNGACKGLITLSPDSDVPTNENGDLAWYFPCMAYNQDGSTEPNKTIPFDQLGYSCHTTASARQHFYSLQRQGEVYFTWDDINNSSRNLMVYSGNVLDLDLLEWFNGSQVTVPAQFEDLRQNHKVRGVDVTHAFQSKRDKQVARCLTEIIRVGSVDTETVGCIASKVVLYVSLVFILSIVLVKFFLALFFSWFFSRRYATPKTSGAASSADRSQQIEEWSDDIYRPPPKLVDANGNVPGDRLSKRASLFPTTSRFTSPYATERATKQRALPTTMASQTSTTRLLPPSPYKHGNGSQGSLPGVPDAATGESRSSLMLSGQEARLSSVMSESEGPGPSGFIHEAVVPQPPPEWQPFGYPLAHAICLVTAYSEGEIGLRTTLDSIATTDYPNSHKLILVICDGMIKGKGEKFTTPEICLGMMKDQSMLPGDVQAFSYVAVASGSKRHNMAKVFAGFYDYGEHSTIPVEKQQRVPMIIVVKCGTPDEADGSKPGNRGKRDSQIILMSFLQKVMFDERMTELEFEMFNGIWKVTGISPDFYEVVLMVDADTKVFPDCLTYMISAMVQDPEIMGLCGETKIANKGESWVTMIQVFE
ncbi:hypothetical protein GP486_007664 [Trichoglossum hirsutum]|uniref:chitin synthase n=1 Tax=Trichoglossum hirsutum TaxID=265104 RepID=A0A9P8IHX7_9PEZI|nr:hypothetical protein GP486_007664 [Trichoglossum hirsutum]